MAKMLCCAIKKCSIFVKLFCYFAKKNHYSTYLAQQGYELHLKN